MKVLIGGGTGFVGRHLRKVLLSKGHEVKVVSRRAGPAAVTWDELSTFQQLPDCDSLVNLSGENILQTGRRWTAEYEKQIFDSRINTNNLLVKLITSSTNRPKSFVTAHAEAIYPRYIGAPSCDETYVVGEPKTWAQRLCFEWENSANLPESVDDVRTVKVRIGIALSKYGGAVKESWWPFYFGLGGKVGTGKQGFPWIHINDLTNLFVHAIETDISGPLNGCAPAQNTNEDYARAFGKALNRPAIFPMPEFVLNTIFGAQRANILLEGSKPVPKKVLESGFLYQYTNLDEAMADVVNS